MVTYLQIKPKTMYSKCMMGYVIFTYITHKTMYSTCTVGYMVLKITHKTIYSTGELHDIKNNRPCTEQVWWVT